MQTPVKDFYNRTIGWVTEDSQGNRVVTDFYRRVVARYNKKSNLTTDFYGRVVGKGDISTSLLFQERNKR